MSIKTISGDEVCAKCNGVTRKTLYNWVRDKRFPPPVQLGPNTLGWIEGEVDKWLRERPRGFLAPVAQPTNHQAA